MRLYILAILTIIINPLKAQNVVKLDSNIIDIAKKEVIIKNPNESKNKYYYQVIRRKGGLTLMDKLRENSFPNFTIEVPPPNELCVTVKQRMENAYFGSTRFRRLQNFANSSCIPQTDCYLTVLCDPSRPFESNTISVTIIINPDPGFCNLSNQLDCPKIKMNANFYLEQSKSTGEVIFLNTVPLITTGVEHYWGIAYNGKAPNCNCSCEDIPLSSIKNAQKEGLFATFINSDGQFQNLGIGTNVTSGTSKYGINYKGFPYYGCYKITHYVVCGDNIKSYTTCVGQSPNN